VISSVHCANLDSYAASDGDNEFVEETVDLDNMVGDSEVGVVDNEAGGVDNGAGVVDNEAEVVDNEAEVVESVDYMVVVLDNLTIRPGERFVLLLADLWYV
jgi:hypothetical protein